MRRILELLMVALVCTNLAFVNITEAARWAWVAPLVALTLAAPYLARFRRFFFYRPIWNCAVIVVFVLLVHHTLTRGMGRPVCPVRATPLVHPIVTPHRVGGRFSLCHMLGADACAIGRGLPRGSY